MNSDFSLLPKAKNLFSDHRRRLLYLNLQQEATISLPKIADIAIWVREKMHFPHFKQSQMFKWSEYRIFLRKTHPTRHATKKILSHIWPAQSPNPQWWADCVIQRLFSWLLSPGQTLLQQWQILIENCLYFIQLVLLYEQKSCTYQKVVCNKFCERTFILSQYTRSVIFFMLKMSNMNINEPLHDKTNKMACAPSEDSDQPGHLPSLIRVFAVRMKKAWVLSYPLSAQRRLWLDWAGLSLRWAHSHFVGFVMRRLKCCSLEF